MRRIALFIGMLLLVGAAPAYAFLGGLFGGSVEQVTARDGQIVLDMKSLEKGASRHYSYQEGDAKIRFFLVRDREGTLRAAFDACEVCRKEGKGYQFENGVMVCVNCGRTFALDRIGVAGGGCNPHPLAVTIEGDTVHVAVKDLLDGAGYFPENERKQ